jgi:5'-nucleotidase
MIFASTRTSQGRMAIALAIALLLAMARGALPAPAEGQGSQAGVDGRSVAVQLLAINDFHGNVEPPTGSSAAVLTEAGALENNGGVEYLATHIRQLEAGNANTLTVAPGDLIGASPLISGYFHDEPTIEAMNALGLDIASVGNHEFDEGSAELLRMQNGGCHPEDGCQDGDGFAGADFPYLSANVVYEGTDDTLFPAYAIRKFGGVKIAFIGLTLEGTPSIVTPAGVAGLEFRDEAETINALVPELQHQNIESIVILLHEGLTQTPSTAAFPNTCNGPSGPLVDIVGQLDPAVDLVISGHTHQQYICELPNAAGDDVVVTSASSFGRLVTDIDIKIDRATRDIFEIAANNVIVTRDVDRDVAETAIISKYAALIADIRNEVVGSITEDLTREQTDGDESTLGNVIADAQLAATDDEFGAVAAFMNPGGIRADIVCEPGEASPCGVTFGELFSVQPFGNDLVTLDLTGAQIDDLLEQQYNNPSAGENRILSVSSSLHYSWDPAAAQGDKVDDSSISIGGVTVDPALTYRVTMNSFLSTGGDNFSVFAAGTNRVIGMVDLDALVDYFQANSPVAPPALDRITAI